MEFYRQVFVVLLAIVGTCNADCTIDLKKWDKNQKPLPLILKDEGGKPVFHNPDSNGKIIIATTHAVRLVCSGVNNFIHNVGHQVKDVQATCVGGIDWTINNNAHLLSEFFCEENPYSETKITSDACNNDTNSLIDVGFRVGTFFIKIMDICFDQINLNAVWSKYDLLKTISGAQAGKRPIKFSAEVYYPGLKPDTQYDGVTQRNTIAVLLGSTAQADKYISQTSNYFLSRGHLTARAGYVFSSQQRATYRYINVAPQWQTLNANNWNTLEDSVREMASSRGLDLEVYTGTHGVTTLPNTNGQETELYLYKDKNNNWQIPVPALFWMVVYNPATKQGVALIGVNNPYIDFANLGGNILCPDVCSQVTWLKWAPKNQQKGFGYCCDVNEFIKEVESLPYFKVTGLLK